MLVVDCVSAFMKYLSTYIGYMPYNLYILDTDIFYYCEMSQKTFSKCVACIFTLFVMTVEQKFLI